MIIVRSPLRITLGGGGTDIPAFYEKHGGICLAAAIDKYVYITLHETLVDDLIVKYSQIERVSDASQVQHPIVREALLESGIDGHGLEIVSIADIHAGTGLGSSSAFTCALVKALHLWKGHELQPQTTAHIAQHIEIERLGEPIGKQDQYISAIGGAQSIMWGPTYVAVDRLPLDQDQLATLERNLLLFYTGITRSASEVLRTQTPTELDLLWVKHLGCSALESLTAGNLSEFGLGLSDQWEAKKQWAPPCPEIQEWYDLGMRNGALGGKLVGAGGGGFLMFYTEKHAELRESMRGAGLREVPFRFDTQGTTVVCQ